MWRVMLVGFEFELFDHPVVKATQNIWKKFVLDTSALAQHWTQLSVSAPHEFLGQQLMVNFAFES